MEFHFVVFQNLFCTFNIVIDRLTAHSKLFCNFSQAVVICVIELDIIHLLVRQERCIKLKERIHSVGFLNFHTFHYIKKAR